MPLLPSYHSGKEPPDITGGARDTGLIPTSGRSPGGGNGHLLQCCLENPMHRGVWWAAVHGITKSQKPLNTHTHTHTHTRCLHLYCICTSNLHWGHLSTLRNFPLNQISSVQSCPTLCNPVDCSMPGLPVHYQLLEFAQTHVH